MARISVAGTVVDTGQHETSSLGSAARRWCQEVSLLGRVRQGRVVRRRGAVMAGPTAASCGPIGGA